MTTHLENRVVDHAGTPRLVFALVATIALMGAPSAPAQVEVCEDGGFALVQVETHSLVGAWREETIVPGYSGDSYYRWDGPNFFDDPGHAILTYNITIQTPGTYLLKIRNYHDDPDPYTANDCWTRMDGGSWIKTFSHINNNWTWATLHQFSEGNDVPAEYTLSAGTHVFEISGRSKHFRIDKIHFFLDTLGNPGQSTPETTCGVWTDLGNGKPGTGGLTPVFEGEGTLLEGATTTLSLTDALPGTGAFLILGVAVVNAPFKKGVLVPSPNIVLGAFDTGPLGEVVFPFPWFPGFPSGGSLYWQYWIQDPGGQAGFSASNGLQSTAP